MNKEIYEVKLHKAIAMVNAKALRSICEEMIAEGGRDGGLMAYAILEDCYDVNFEKRPEAEENVLFDILEAMTGYCDNVIGEGNYHIKN